ncbi:MAG: SPASM domain-containing protein, partial [bacterium]
ISALFQPQEAAYFRDFYAEAKEACREAASLATETFTVFNMFGERLQDLFASSPDYSFCGTSRMTTYLAADCTIYTCCMNAYNERGAIGSFKNQRLRDLWASDSLRDRLFALDATRCPPCMYNGKNAAIAYAMAPHPLHVSFV